MNAMNKVVSARLNVDYAQWTHCVSLSAGNYLPKIVCGGNHVLHNYKVTKEC